MCNFSMNDVFGECTFTYVNKNTLIKKIIRIGTYIDVVLSIGTCKRWLSLHLLPWILLQTDDQDKKKTKKNGGCTAIQ